MIVVSRERRVDWARLVENLRKSGMSAQEIADRIGVVRASVLAYCDDRNIEPAYWVGASLLVLWAERTGLPWTDAPTRRVQESVSRMLKATA